MSKRAPGGSLAGLMTKKTKLDERTGGTNNNDRGGGNNGLNNPFLARPIPPKQTFQIYLTQVRNSARKYLPTTTKFPVTKPYCEVEARLGILRIQNRRVTSSGPKRINGAVAQAFDAKNIKVEPSMVSGVSRSHYVSWTQAGLSEVSQLSTALGCVVKPNMSNREAIKMIKDDLIETEYVETVFAGYKGERRVSFEGYVDPQHPRPTKPGQMEYKEKLNDMDFIFPAAKYDMRIGLASEKVVDPNVTSVPPGWALHRVKRRRSYKRRDTSMAWQIDVTEVTSTPKDDFAKKTVAYEIEMELQASAMLQLINEESQEGVAKLTNGFANQLWWILQHLNPLVDIVDVEEHLRDHPDKKAVQLALATCGALKKFMDRPPPATHPAPFDSPLARPHETPSPALANIKFCGCMPVNFSRHNIEDVQQAPENGYFLSEKTDGVRHFMVFTGDTVVLVDRAMRGKQPIPLIGDKSASEEDPMASVIPLIQPGTVFDGEVVMNRGGSKHKARPVFIVFDILTIGPTTAVLHMPFEKRLEHLRKATFRTKTANRDMFADSALADPNIPLPLVRKNFVARTQIETLLSNVVEDKGSRSFRMPPVHNHLTDGIIFQPNLPYVCGTDVNLLKWKYLDTVTIDVEIMQEGFQNYRNRNEDEDALITSVMGAEQTAVDMSRYVKLPPSERFRLEADKYESGAKIAEVGFDPMSGEWYYLTMRPDKIAPNHISTVLGTLLELSESLTTEELQYRMSVPTGQRDTYRKDLNGMLKQLLDHQKKQLRR
jgi:mRNA guanylyltransferase